ncbi:MAG: acyl-CoA dehydrogenase family protein [Ilumatobacteraceae bacterium]|jgi:alkylation response protein AidB-like acyl-CoA dehydrogenase
MSGDSRLPLDATSTDDDVREVVGRWVLDQVPQPWRDAADRGRAAIRAVRTRQAYEDWYPVFAASGLVVPTWPVAYGGLGLRPAQARVAEGVLAPFNLGRLNPLGLNNAAAPLFAHGTEEQRLRYLPPIVANTERWCQLFSEPGAGSDLASLATRAERDGDEWMLTGQKVWTTWAHESEFGVCLARTDPRAPKRQGITFFIVDLRAPGVEVRELRHLGGEVDFNEVWLDAVRVHDRDRVGAVGDGWRVGNATLAGERQMVAGAGSGGVDRIGGSGAERLIASARRLGRWDEPVTRQRLIRLLSEERIRRWTNDRVRAAVKAGGTPGPGASIGKLHQGALNQRMQIAAADLLGAAALAWTRQSTHRDPASWAADLPYEVAGMLRSLANTIEGGTTEINKNIVGEQILGLAREPDPYHGKPWEDTPRS